MHVYLETFTVHKRFTLTISRGTTAQTTNIWVRIEQDGIEGWGEASPFSTGYHPQTTEFLLAELQKIIPLLEKFSPLERQPIEQLLTELKLPSAARAALDMALQDWLGKKVGLPLWQLWGLDRSRIVPTSVTVGLNSPEGGKQRVQDWFGDSSPQGSLKYRAVKIKLGSPDGIEADCALFEAVQKAVPAQVQISVDANGGWNLNDAIKMCHWLEQYGVKYVEQPLSPAAPCEDFLTLYRQSPLPIFVDESCWNSRDIPLLADRVHGINIKLMKSGGLTEALRMIHTAKAYGLQVMFGCYSDSVMANTAAAQLSPFADYLDLDSHLNLKDDPFIGAVLQAGCLFPNERPGLGISLVQSEENLLKSR